MPSNDPVQTKWHFHCVENPREEKKVVILQPFMSEQMGAHCDGLFGEGNWQIVWTQQVSIPGDHLRRFNELMDGHNPSLAADLALLKCMFELGMNAERLAAEENANCP